MTRLSPKQTAKLILKLGKKRIAKLEDFGYEGSGFDIVLNEGLESAWGTTMRYYEFEEYKTQAELLDDMKSFIDSTE